VTGIATAAIVSVTLSRVSIDVEPGIPRTPMRLLRGVIYVPVLLFEIVKANIEVARVILDPRLPIEPTMNRMRVIVGSGLPLMTLANSITLTPGTLTVRARDSDLYVHSLIPSARDGLFDGSLERWTRFVYYGRASARLPTPPASATTARSYKGRTRPRRCRSPPLTAGRILIPATARQPNRTTRTERRRR